MPGKHLFEYAVVRVMPRVEREEFINVGIILFCASQRFLQANMLLNKERLLALNQEIDLDCVEENLQAMVRICEGGLHTGPIGQLDTAGRFRWLTATRSTIIQASKVHPGFCKDAKETLEKLVQELVK